MTLRITLRDGEKVIVNGAVLRAAGRTQLYVENDVALLRGRDVMRPEEADTPAKRLYFACMMAYIDEENRLAHQDAIVQRVQELIGALQAPEARAVCIEFAGKVAGQQFYRALSDCRWLIAYEAELLAYTPDAAPQILPVPANAA